MIIITIEHIIRVNQVLASDPLILQAPLPLPAAASFSFLLIVVVRTEVVAAKTRHSFTRGVVSASTFCVIRACVMRPAVVSASTFCEASRCLGRVESSLARTRSR